MQEQALHGHAPPAGVVMDTAAGALVRDTLGNVTGGVRLPSMEAPIATYVSTASVNPFLPPALQGIGTLACRLSGAVVPFDDATIDALYPERGEYIGAVIESALDLKAKGLLLQRDALTLIIKALRSDVAK